MKTLPAVLLLAAVGLPAHAQHVSESSGQGSLSFGTQNDALRSARLEMALTGSATLQLGGTNVPGYTLQGRWTAQGADAVRLTIAQGFGDSAASGTGTARLQGDRLVSLQLSGSTRAGRYSISFQGSTAPAATPTPNPNPRGFSLDQNLGAGGEIRGAKGTTRVERAHVILRQDGTAQITLRGPQTSTLTGTWKDGGRDTYTVDVVSGFGSDKTRATVNVYLSRSQLFSVEGKGTSPGQGGDFTLKVGGR